MSGTLSPKESSSSGSAASFTRVIEQLIESDEEQIKANQMLELQGLFPVLRKLTPEMSNQEKVSMFMRDSGFRQRLVEKLSEQLGTERLPIIKVKLFATRFRSQISQELDEGDLVKVFERFGHITSIFVAKAEAFIQFGSMLSSYMAVQTMHDFEVIRDVLCLEVRWCDPEEVHLAESYFNAKFASITSAFSGQQSTPNAKFNCKYHIHLACKPEFKLPQKLIGPKGNNIKKIFELIAQRHKVPAIKEVQSKLKMRLRGKGSGYQEPHSQESNEILNFCISSKEGDFYCDACAEVERNFEKLASDFKFQFERLHRKSPSGTVYVKYELSNGKYFEKKTLKLEQLQSAIGDILSEQQKIDAKEIDALINKRNKARKAGRYKEADTIRQKLKLRGVLLTDGKNNSGLTTWKYVLPSD